MATHIILPKLTYEMRVGHIIEWLAGEGDPVSIGQPLFVVETDKAAVEVAAEAAGVLLRILVPAGQTVPVGTPVAWSGTAGERVPAAVDAPSPVAPSPVAQAAGGAEFEAVVPAAEAAPSPDRTGSETGETGVPASPLARRMARELGVDLAAVLAFSGSRRVREADVQAYVEAQGQPGPAAPAYELVRPTPLQRAMAERMTQAAAVPQMAAGCELTLAACDAFRAAQNRDWEARHGYRLSYTHLLAALAVHALVANPRLNASWTDEGLRLFRAVDLGVAMAGARGLVVPVVRGAERRSLAELGAEIVRLQRAVEANRLPPGEMEGGTFTLTNVGMLGITHPVPLLMPPQAAILAVGARREQLVLVENQVVSRPLLTLTLVVDHRLVDGAMAAAFLASCRELAQTPERLLAAAPAGVAPAGTAPAGAAR